MEKGQFLDRALYWSQQFSSSCLLNSNALSDEYSKFDCALFVAPMAEYYGDNTDSFAGLDKFKTNHPNQWVIGFFSYDLKNQTEALFSGKENPLNFPDCYFFAAGTVLLFDDANVTICSSQDPALVYESISTAHYPDIKNSTTPFSGTFTPRMSQKEYIAVFHKLQDHIARGDIYEVNLCQEFYAENTEISPVQTYWKLNEASPTPFSCFFKLGDKYILSASPERFFAKRGDTLLSQPIKGTAPRGNDEAEDLSIKNKLLHSPKEIAENVMIVDLVRNDLTRCALPGTVKAEKQLEIKSFKQVHQLVSTVSCTLSPAVSPVQAIKSVYPAGSMTGAPKISAMQLCEDYETSRRGVYSGAIGYFSPDGDFDFNVVIRTLLYNQEQRYLSFHTGGAITISAEATQEYEECLLKAKGILAALDTTISNP